MRLRLLVAAMVLVVPGIASAQSMNAETFFQKAKALQRKGMMAMFSKDVKLLVGEAKAAGEAARADRLATIRAGAKPRYCPPRGAQRMNSDEFMNRLGSMARPDRMKIDMTEAMIRIQVAKFPC